MVEEKTVIQYGANTLSRTKRTSYTTASSGTLKYPTSGKSKGFFPGPCL